MHPKFILGLYIFITLLASILQVLKNHPDSSWTSYNNYLIFKTSFQHLVSGGDLYQLWPSDHQDYYKYSPLFALLMAPFSALNIMTGLCIWNLINALTLYFAIFQIKHLSQKAKVFILLFILLELLTSIQNSQSNGLMTALMIFAFNKMESGKSLMANLLLSLAFFIKIFSLAGFILLLLYPNKIKSILYAALCMGFLFFLPLLAVSYSQLIFLYGSWIKLLSNDHSASIGLSVMGFFQTWFALDINKSLLAIIGMILLLLPLIRIKQYVFMSYRMLILASVLIWVIIFNHKAESPTFIVAMSGVAIWYFSEKRNRMDLILLILTFVFTSLSPTDLFPKYIRMHLVIPYVLKAVPCIIIWGKILWELMTKDFGKQLKIASE